MSETPNPMESVFMTWAGDQLDVTISGATELHLSVPVGIDRPLVRVPGAGHDVWWEPPTGQSTVTIHSDQVLLETEDFSITVGINVTRYEHLLVDFEPAFIVPVPQKSCGHSVRPAEACPYWPPEH